MVFGLSLLGDAFAPIDYPSSNPFNLKFVQFDNKVLANRLNKNNLNVSIQNSSYAVKESVKDNLLILDGEITELSINYSRKVSEKLDFYLKVPIYSFSKGFLDQPIEEWHKLLGLSDGSREHLSKDQLHYEVQVNSIKEVFQDSFIGIGDIQISSKLNFYSKNYNDLNFITILELPSGSQKKNFGNGYLDGIVALNLRNTEIDNLIIDSVFGLSIFNEKNNQIIEEKNLASFSKILLSWQPEYFFSKEIKNSLIYKINFEIFEPQIKSDFKSLGDVFYIFGLGATYRIAANKYFNFGFSEDIKVNSSADFSFIFGFDFKI